MKRKLGVLVIHGMGNQGSGFANGMIDDVSNRLKGQGVDPAVVAWKSVWWAPVLSERQESLLREMASRNDLDMMKLRRFVIHSLADAIAYEQVQTDPDQKNMYEEIHGIVATAMSDLRLQIRQGWPETAPDVPLMIVAHSLGCHIISNYIWDIQKNQATVIPPSAFERMESLSGICTFGCNIPLFTFAYKGLKPIDFPPPQLANYFPHYLAESRIREVARWINYYDPDDILGYPLKQISNEYDQVVSADVAINVGNLLVSWNPGSHVAYWEDENLTKPIAKQISDLLAVL